MVLGLIFVGMCALYGAAFFRGWRLAKMGVRTPADVIQTRSRLVDPLTRRFQEWGRQRKLDAIRHTQWTRLLLLIFVNNFIGVAVIGRTVYSLTIVLGIYLTYRQGLTQGVLLAHPSIRPSGVFVRVAVLEFGSYLLASALALNLVASLVVGGFMRALTTLGAWYWVIAIALMIGAWLEVRAVRDRLPQGLNIPQNVNPEELRAKALEMLRRQGSTESANSQS